MKTRRRLVAAALLVSMLLSLYGGGLTNAAAVQAPTTVTTDRELAYDPLAQTASIAYEQHEDGYAVSLDRTEDSVTMSITAVPGEESSRTAENARLYIRTGVTLKAGTAYRVGFSLWAENAQPEYAIRFDGGAEEAAYGVLEGRSVKAGSMDKVQYQVTPETENGELVLCLLLGKTGGNTFRFSGLAVEEAPKNVTGGNTVLVDELNYNAPGFIRYWTHTDRAAAVTCDGKSATLTVTKGPLKDAEVWKIKLFVATGLKPVAGKTYHLSVDIDSAAKQGFELCYNEGDTEKGFGAEYSQRLTGQAQTLEYMIRIPKDKTNPGELILQFSLGKLKTGDAVTISNISIEEAFPNYRDVLSENFSFDEHNTSVATVDPTTRITNVTDAPAEVNWDSKAAVTKSGDYAGGLMISGGGAALEINGGENLWDARFNIDTGEVLTADETYRISFDVQADRPYSNYEVLYGTALNGVDNNQAYGALKGLSLAADTPETVSYMLTPDSDGGLLVSLQLGATGGRGNMVAVSNFKIEKVVAGQPGIDNLASVIYPSGGETPTPPDDENTGSFRVRDGHGSITGDGSSVTMTCEDVNNKWEKGLFIDKLCDLAVGKSYQVSFDIQTDGQQFNYNICYNRNDHFGEGQEKGFAAKYDAAASSSKSTVTQIITPEEGKGGKLLMFLEFANASTGTKVTVSNIQVKEYKDGSAVGSNLAETTYPSSTPPTPPGEDEDSGSFSVRADGDYGGTITGDGSSATITCTGGDAGEGNIWKRGMFTGEICQLSAEARYQVSFDISATVSTLFEVCYNKDEDWGDGKEKGFGWQGGLTADTTASTVTQAITPDANGKLRLRIDLGRAAEGTKVTVSNIQVKKLEGTPTGDNLADSVNYNGFTARDSQGNITSNGNSATITCAAPEDNPQAWQRGMFTGEICQLSTGTSYQVSFDITATTETSLDICYNKDEDWGNGEGAFGHEYSLTASSESSTVTHTITPDADGKLRMRIDLGLAAEGTEVTVSNIQVKKLEEQPTGDNLAAMTYPSGSSSSQSDFRMKKTNPGRIITTNGNYAEERTAVLIKYNSTSGFPLVKKAKAGRISTVGMNFTAGRATSQLYSGSSTFSVREVDTYGGTIAGDGTSATITCTGGDAGEAWKRGMFTGDIARLSAGKSYLVSFDVMADNSTPFEVCYNKNKDWDEGEKGFGGEYGLTAASTPSTVTHTVTADADSTLRLRIDLGRAAEGTAVTISNIQVREIGYAAVSEEQINGFSSVWAEGIEGYTADLTKGADNAVLKVTKPDTDATGWKAKLFIRTGVVYDPNKNYRAQFDITAEDAVKEFCVISQGVPDSEDIRGTWSLTLDAGETKTITTRPVPGDMGTGELVLQLELGNFDGTENIFTVSNVKVEEVDLDISYEYVTKLTCRGNSASLNIKETPVPGMMEFWKVKLFVDTGFYAEKGETYRVAFDTWTGHDMDFEVNYNRVPDKGDEEESGYGSAVGLHAVGNKETTTEYIFTASRDGILRLQIMLGKVPESNVVSVRNLRVERVTYSYAHKSALPVEVEYKVPSAVSYWAHEDYTTTFTGTDSSITANITSAPENGAEPWKIKLFLDTGTVLKAGKYYRVTANVSAKSPQDYEICYNNGGIEMGYDSLGGLRLAGGETQTVEKIISVPAGKSDVNHLTLQFNLGKTTAANAVTVSGVKVEEVPFSYIDAMPKDFTYTANRTVSLWTNPDYTASLEASDGTAALHISGVPETGAEVWKVKLFVNTGAVLSAGKTYLVRADLLAAKAQNYEVCFNNEETEKGFDALYNQAIGAGSKTTVEKQISVPASMTDAGELILQFSMGGAVANDVTVSNVSVRELNFGVSDGNPAPDTVVSLSSGTGKLDVSHGKLLCKMPEDTPAGVENAVTIAGADLRAGELYTVTFTARSDRDLTGTAALKTADGGTTVISAPFHLTSKETTYSFTTKERLNEGGLYDLLWQFGAGGNQKSDGAQVEISGITVTSPPESLNIVHGKQNVTVNGKAVSADTYNINGSNYIKLRDLALLLNDTDAQFVVRYNKKNSTISLTTGKPYTPVGGELAISENQAASCVRSPANVTVNGKAVNLKAYNIGRNNFFRLRDLNELLGFQVDYDAANNAAAVTSPLTPEAQEKAHAYDLFFLPEVDGESQPYVGDTMPFYDNGVYYIYYLKDGGDSYNHSVYVAETKDFVHYTEHDAPVLSASREDVQDNWIGTGSVVKVDETYYFFYTGFNGSGSQEYREKIMVAKGSSPTSFEKIAGWEITPPAELGQKNDFRDPQAYYDPASKSITLTVTAAQDGKARILKYTLGKNLQTAKYDGIIFTDPTGAFWNLECSDTFQMGDKWYLTYSGQEDTLWYAMANSRFGPYSNAVRLEGKLFYAAKHVEDGENSYMVGWARRANSASSTQEVSGWAGNIAVQKLCQQEDGSLALAPVDNVVSAFETQEAVDVSEITLKAGPGYSFKDAFASSESFMLKGEFTYTGTGSFGLAFDFNGKEEQYKLISIDPTSNKLQLSFNKGATPITETQAALYPNQKHSFTYIQDGSVGIFYLDGKSALTVRLYGVTDKPICLFAENSSVTFTSLRQYTR